MNQITIRDLDPGLLKLLKQTAWQNGTLVEEYVRQLIVEALQRSHQATQPVVEQGCRA
jgi:plasmid stability protein